ncbi:MAG: DUF1549 domain-containing protein [Planctomycetaceae bacterium]|nr:DUF1549 domain-containing protein [Planctomycetaceae bacterium]
MHAADDDAAVEFFEKKVRPLLVDHCYTCHSADTNSKSGLRVDDRNGLLAGGDRGPAILPGKPQESLLIEAVSQVNEKLKMPPDGKLSDDEIATLTQWIADGAAWTKVPVPASLGQSNAEHERLRKEHWAWQPLQQAPVPQVRDAAWARDDLDRFILARLDERDLQPVADADRMTLIRRVTFDLTGLPPTPAEVSGFLKDASPQAFERLVDRLLASPAWGERWGRHWLDVARYGESTGSSRNMPYPHAWRYRDYVIDAFNNDKPYDRFLREQIAGDLLPATSVAEKAEQLVATGFLALGVKDVNQRFKVRYIMDNVDEQIDTVTRSVLALTASCARCHDHKFDPIPTTDYYALAGIFRSSDLCAGLRSRMGGGGLDYYDTQMLLPIGLGGPVLPTNEKIAQARRAVDVARAEFQRLREAPEGAEPAADGRPKRDVAKESVERLQAELDALSDPAAGGAMAVGVRDSKTVGDTEVRIRGEAEKLGPMVPRGFLSLVQFPGQPQVNPRQSGRLELAWWLSSDQNPLTLRVMTNRIWQHLFGEGLVKTVDNFGVHGDVPSHPELLDHLAARFVRNGWSIKKLVRALVLSRTYQLGAEATAAHLAVDPANRLVWRHSPRRLDAEEIRDAILAASGRLNLTHPEASPAKALRIVELSNNGPEAKRLVEQARVNLHRSVYLPLLRGITPAALEAFDFAEQGMVTGRRDQTTVAPQALYLLNDPFVRDGSLALAARLLARVERDGAQPGDAEPDDLDRIHRAYRLTVCRPPTSHEVDRAMRYLSEYEEAQRALLALSNAGNATPAATTTAEAAAAANAGGALPPKPEPVVPVNPDERPRADQSSSDDPLVVRDPRAAAWASFCQALFSAAEFRYLR